MASHKQRERPDHHDTASRKTAQLTGKGIILPGQGKETGDTYENKIIFNNIVTVRKKVMLCKEKGLAGIMIWQVAQDSREKGRSVIAEISSMLNEK